MTKNDGSGGYWRETGWVAIGWGDKISTGLAKRKKVSATCDTCGKSFKVYPNSAKTARWCSKKCGYAGNYTNVADPIKKKAIVCGANLLMGKGKREFLMGLIKAALGHACQYCPHPINLQNMTVDHMEAYKSSKARRNKTENKKLRAHFDRRENLQIICKNCNQLKGELDHGQFIALKEFLSTDPWLETVVLRRLRRSNAPFRRSAR